MPNLTKLLAIALMTTGLGLTACKTEPAKAKEVPVAKPTETAPTEAKPTETKPTETTPTEAKPVAAAGDLPAECGEYKAAIEKLATCDKLPQQTRDALKQSYEQTSTAWASVPAEGKAALATACKSAADAVKQSATACQ
jgi:curli biogenesis system outer membrane secretion channel CsgG